MSPPIPSSPFSTTIYFARRGAVYPCFQGGQRLRQSECTVRREKACDRRRSSAAFFACQRNSPRATESAERSHRTRFPDRVLTSSQPVDPCPWLVYDGRRTGGVMRRILWVVTAAACATF